MRGETRRVRFTYDPAKEEMIMGGIWLQSPGRRRSFSGLATATAIWLIPILCWAPSPASAQPSGAPGAPDQLQTTGAPGAPDATTTIDGRYLPNPPQPFQGEIKLNAARSKPAWPARIVPPKGAPNILLIMTDDVGFAAPSTFGGVHSDAGPGPDRQ